MRSRARSDRGQATVELALCIPIVCLMLLGAVQVALVVRDRLVVELAARDGARAAAVSDAPHAAATAAARSVGIPPDASVGVVSNGAVVTVTVTATSRTDLPLVGALIPDVTLHASATMLAEPP